MYLCGCVANNWTVLRKRSTVSHFPRDMMVTCVCFTDLQQQIALVCDGASDYHSLMMEVQRDIEFIQA